MLHLKWLHYYQIGTLECSAIAYAQNKIQQNRIYLYSMHFIQYNNKTCNNMNIL